MKNVNKNSNNFDFYVINNMELPRVTNIIKILDKGDVLIKWALKEMSNYLFSLVDKGITNEDILEGKKQYEIIKNNSLDIGSLLHKFLEEHIKGNLFVEINNELIRNMYKGFLEWEKEYVDYWIGSEVLVYKYNEQECVGYAGTIDGIAVMKNKKIYIIDFKTSNSIYDDYKIQVLGAYYQAYNNMLLQDITEYNFFDFYNFGRANGAGILRFDKNNSKYEWCDLGNVSNIDFIKQQKRYEKIFNYLNKLYYLLNNNNLKNNKIKEILEVI